MRLFALVASAALLLSSSASAHVFDPQASFIYLQLGGLQGNSVGGQANAPGNATLTGGVGAETITMIAKGMGFPNLFQAVGVTNGTEFFTGTPTVDNLFFTVQNSAGTFANGVGKGTFQGNALCTTSCFGGNVPIVGQVLIQIGAGQLPVDMGIVGGGGKSTVALGPAAFVQEGAQWVTEAVQITNIASNIVTVTNAANGRAGATGIGFTLRLTVNENVDLQLENGVTVVTVAGTTEFQTAAATSGVNQVTMVSPVHSDSGSATGNPPIPGVGIMVLRYVPEPASLLLLGTAVGGLLVFGRKRMKR